MDLYLGRQLVIAGIIYIGSMLVGFGMGWTSPVIPKLQDLEETPLPDVITDGEASWVGSLLYVGTIIGPYITGYLSNVIGRKPCLIIGGVITAISFVMVVISRNLTMVFASRIVKGFGIGIIAVVNMVYLGEIASTNIRGILLTSTGIFSTLGTLVIYAGGPYISYAGTGWFGLGLTACYIISACFIPESPVYQVLKGRDDEAIKTLVTIGRAHETESVLATKIQEKNGNADWQEIFTIKSNRKALFITLTLGIMQQMSGVVAVIFFATTIFELAGSSITPHIATIVIGVTQLVSSAITPFFVERSGRRTLLLVSTSVCCVSLTVLGTYFYLDDIESSSLEQFRWLPLATLMIFFTFYDLGFGIIPGTFTGEMFRSNVRSPGSALTVTTGWLVGFGVATGFGYLITSVGGHWTFWWFAASCAAATLFTALFVPETKGKSLLEIQEMLS